MKKLMIIALGAVVLLSGCNGGNNVTPEESEVNITESVSESQNESVTTDIKTTSEDKPVSEKKQHGFLQEREQRLFFPQDAKTD